MLIQETIGKTHISQLTKISERLVKMMNQSREFKMIKLKDLIKEEVCNCGCGGCETELKEGVVGAKKRILTTKKLWRTITNIR